MSEAVAEPVPPKPPCYRQAFYRKQSGRITEREYFHYIFLHLSKDSVKHKGDDYVRSELEFIDPLGYSINQWIVRVMPVDDPTPFENVFDTFRVSNGSVEELRTSLEKIELYDSGAKKPGPYVMGVRKSLALLALQERKATVLTWLFKEGIEIEDVFEDEVRRVQKKKDPMTWKALQDEAQRTGREWAKRRRPRRLQISRRLGRERKQLTGRCERRHANRGHDFPVALTVALARHVFLGNTGLANFAICIPKVTTEKTLLEGIPINENRNYSCLEIVSLAKKKNGWASSVDTLGVWSLAADVKTGLVSGEDLKAFQAGVLLERVEARRKDRSQVLPFWRGGPISVAGHSWVVRKLLGVEVYLGKR